MPINKVLVVDDSITVREVERMLVEQQERTRLALTAHRGALEAVATALLEHETLSGTDVLALVDKEGR